MLYLQLQCYKKQNKNKQEGTSTAATTTKKNNGGSYARAFLEIKESSQNPGKIFENAP